MSKRKTTEAEDVEESYGQKREAGTEFHSAILCI